MDCPLCGAANQAEEFCSDCGQRISGPSIPDTPSAPLTIERPGGAREQAARAYLQLEPSETAVLHASSRLFAAYIASGRVDSENEGEYMRLAVARSIELAVLVERNVQSDGEDW